MTVSHNQHLFARLVQTFAPQSILVRAWPLTGGVSAQVTALEIAHPDGYTKKLIVRQHGAADRARDPQIAAHEFALLRHLHAAGLATPKPYYLDQSGEIFALPVVVVEYIEGTPGFAAVPNAAHIQQFTEQLCRIHALDCARLDMSFLPQQITIAEQVRAQPAIAQGTAEERRIWETLRSVRPPAQPNPTVLLHGDFWPGNTLWQAERLVAVIDWEDATLGDPLADVANSRLELLWAAGIDASHSFTQQYQATTRIDSANLPYWDLLAALRPARNMSTWGLDAHTERTMRDALELFIDLAIAKLAAR